VADRDLPAAARRRAGLARKLTLVVAWLLLASTAWPLKIGGEFMPPLDEGDLLYMPTALPGLSAARRPSCCSRPTADPHRARSAERLRQGRPRRDRHRPGAAGDVRDHHPVQAARASGARHDSDRLVEELDRIVKVPGLSNIWVPPIRNRIDMLATGIKSPVGVKVAGPTWPRSTAWPARSRLVKGVPGVSSALAERLTGGRYVDVNINRDVQAARYGLNIADVQSVISSAVGGENVGETVEGLQRFPINVRYPREVRDSLESCASCPS
jgi:Cu(I)/Ag(I) efflux system membrane protein CusA/SilA